MAWRIEIDRATVRDLTELDQREARFAAGTGANGRSAFRGCRNARAIEPRITP